MAIFNCYISAFVCGILLIYAVLQVESTGEVLPQQGFFTAVKFPELGRKAGSLYVYALKTGGFIPEEESIFLYTYPFELPEKLITTEEIESDGMLWGYSAEVKRPTRNTRVRYGVYAGFLIDHSDFMITESHGFVKAKSRILNTKGVYTRTFYPASDELGETDLAPADPIVIDSSSARFGRKIIWSKGGRRKANTGLTLTLDKIKGAAGFYIIHRLGRGRRGWFVVIEVIVATCSEGSYYDSDDEMCREQVDCKNGGVHRNNIRECICPPFFGGFLCDSRVEPVDVNQYNLGHVPGTEQKVNCRDLEGGNRNCRGFLFCFGDLYGCKCVPGFYGNNCDQPCRRGRYGPDCNQDCSDDPDNCDPVFGFAPHSPF